MQRFDFYSLYLCVSEGHCDTRTSPITPGDTKNCVNISGNDLSFTLITHFHLTQRAGSPFDGIKNPMKTEENSQVSHGYVVGVCAAGPQ